MFQGIYQALSWQASAVTWSIQVVIGQRRPYCFWENLDYKVTHSQHQKKEWGWWEDTGKIVHLIRFCGAVCLAQ